LTLPGRTSTVPCGSRFKFDEKTFLLKKISGSF
jgi:hypothetical protein